MKKFAIGCGIAFIICALAGAGISYWLYRKVSSTVRQLAELGSVPEIERQVRNSSAFTPPESGELTQAQVQRLIRVQTQVRQRLGQRFSELEEKYRTLSEKKEATALDLPELISAYRDLAATWMDAKRAQVDALNAASFSLDEYRWVRSQVYTAVGLPYMEIDVAKIVDDIKSGRPSEAGANQLRGSMGPSGPESNQKLIAPYKKELEDNVALASFGL